MPTVTARRMTDVDSEKRRAVLEKVLENYTRKGKVKFSEAFKDHPEWAQEIGWSNPMLKQRAYAQMGNLREKRAGAKGRIYWTQEHANLVRAIAKDPAFKDQDGTVKWANAMLLHPEWADTLNYRQSRGRFQAFVVRVLHDPNWRGHKPKGTAPDLAAPVQLMEPAPAAPTNGNGQARPGVIVLHAKEMVEINGTTYRVAEIAQKLEDYTAKLCPECGFNLQWLHNAYNIARRHS